MKVPESGARSVGTDKTVEGKLAPNHARKHETDPPRVKKEKEKKYRLDFWFYLSWRKQNGQLEDKHLIESQFVTNSLLFEHHQKTAR